MTKAPMDSSQQPAVAGLSVSEPMAEDPVRILYMEDDAVTARIVQLKLQKAGYTVTHVGDGGEGLKKLEQGDFDIALIDKNMPVRNGLEVILEVSESDWDPRPSMIMLTAGGDERAAVEAMKSGASDYIVKDPENQYLELLPPVIERVLQERQLEQQKRRAEQERKRLIEELQQALAQVKTLSGLLPICMHCKKIRDDKGSWERIEVYVSQHSEAEFSHGLCQSCAKEFYSDFEENEKKGDKNF
ncbi:response regulator [Acidobacteria bacterium AH-259-A15]|nr:response regulator [Acidobacteria bacterium AH-259-A15]